MSLLDDFMAEIKAKTRKAILATGESYNEPHMMCPYCAHEQREDWESGIETGGEELEYQCDNCERHFMYKTETRFSTRKLK